MTQIKALDPLAFGNTIQLVGTVWSDGHQEFVAYLPGDRTLGLPMSRLEGESPTETAPISLDEWMAILRQTDLLEMEILAHTQDGNLTKVILRKSARQISQEVSWVVFRRDGYRCRYCGNDRTPLTVDHLVLWEAGGPSTPENLATACRKCNKTRGNQEYASWLASPHYAKVSKGLTDEVRKQNLDIVKTLDAIPRMVHKPSKR